MSLFEECLDNIQKTRIHLRLPFGYRFLYVPRENLEHNNGLVILGLNPGGRDIQSIDDVPGGNAYLLEKWKSRLQNKMTELWTSLAIRNSWTYEEWTNILNESVTANVVPFISPTYDFFTREQSALIRRFSIALWRRILGEVKPKVILCLGQMSMGMVYEAIPAIPLMEEQRRESRQIVNIFRYQGGLTMIKIPHLAHWASYCDHPKLLEVVAREMEVVHSSLPAHGVSLDRSVLT